VASLVRAGVCPFLPRRGATVFASAFHHAIVDSWDIGAVRELVAESALESWGNDFALRSSLGLSPLHMTPSCYDSWMLMLDTIERCWPSVLRDDLNLWCMTPIQFINSNSSEQNSLIVIKITEYVLATRSHIVQPQTHAAPLIVDVFRTWTRTNPTLEDAQAAIPLLESLLESTLQFSTPTQIGCQWNSPQLIAFILNIFGASNPTWRPILEAAAGAVPDFQWTLFEVVSHHWAPKTARDFRALLESSIECLNISRFNWESLEISPLARAISLAPSTFSSDLNTASELEDNWSFFWELFWTFISHKVPYVAAGDGPLVNCFPNLESLCFHSSIQRLCHYVDYLCSLNLYHECQRIKEALIDVKAEIRERYGAPSKIADWVTLCFNASLQAVWVALRDCSGVRQDPDLASILANIAVNWSVFPLTSNLV
jgi:hypothetical protein